MTNLPMNKDSCSIPSIQTADDKIVSKSVECVRVKKRPAPRADENQCKIIVKRHSSEEQKHNHSVNVLSNTEQKFVLSASISFNNHKKIIWEEQLNISNQELFEMTVYFDMKHL